MCGYSLGQKMSNTVPALYVPPEIASQAEIFIRNSTGSLIRDGIELLLTHGKDLSSSASLDINVGSLLQQGLSVLSNSPYQALDIEVSAELLEVKKAYKRMALKYHPDKNPSTTPLFHVIHGAYEKLMQKTESTSSQCPPNTATSPTKPKSTSSKSTDTSKSNPSGTDGFRQYQSKGSKFTTYRDPGGGDYDHPKPPKFDEPESRWAGARSSMAGDNDPLPGQNTYEGFRSYTQFPQERKQSARAAQSTGQRCQQSSESRKGDDIKERSKRRQEEYEAASKRIAERRAKQQQRKEKYERPRKTSNSQDSFQLPVPSEVLCTCNSEASVDITWKRYTHSSSQILKLELSWRMIPTKISNSSWKTGQSKSQIESPEWIVSSHLITANTIRKKNLTLGAQYEFRLRYVLIVDENNCDYLRGDWSEPVSIVIALPPSSIEQRTSFLNSRTSLEISGLKAKGLHSRTLFGISNPYVACTINGVRYKTSVMSHTNHPVWNNEKIFFHNVSLHDSLHLEIFDKELISRKSLLGEIYIPLSDFKMTEMMANWMILTGGSSEESDDVSQVYVCIRVVNEKTGNQNSTTSFLPFQSDQYYESGQSLPQLIYYRLIPPPTSIVKEFLYPVFSDASLQTIVGYLTPLKYVLVDISKTEESCMCVQCHFDSVDKLNFLKTPIWGWCERVQSCHTYFHLVSEEYQYQHATTYDTKEDMSEGEGDEESEENSHIPVWYQLRDEDSGFYYYYNEKTGESEWEPPEWVEEYDPISGSRYYVHLNTEDSNPIETTWRKPKIFARLIREMCK